MKIVLLSNVPKVGQKYEVKVVADGFASNSLIPRGLAKTATASVLKEIENLKKNELARKKIREDLLIKSIKDVENISVEVSGKANDKGHLFASIHAKDIVKAVQEQTGLGFDTDHLVLKEPLKEVGEHQIKAKIGELEVPFTVVVKAVE